MLKGMSHCHRLFFTGLVILMFLAGGCAVGPDYVKPTAQEPKDWMEKEDPKFQAEAEPLADWWTVFNDPVLNSLIETAYQQSLTLRIAGIRILEARARLGIAIGNLYPQLQQARGGLTRNGISDNTANTTPQFDDSYGDADVGFDAAWELDFWGKFRRGVQAGYGDLDVTVAGFDDVLVTLTAEVARVYVLIRTLEARLGIARQNVKIQERSLQIAEVRFKAGEVTELDVAQAKSLLGDTQATIPRLESDLRQAKNGLAILLGLLPGEVDPMIGMPKPIPSPPAEVAVGIPSELLRRRPDIRLAERQMAGQSARIGLAKADLYPHFTLFGSIGLRASDAALTAAGFPGGSSFSDIWDSDSIEFGFGPAFRWDIFNYGRITNRVRVQDARFQQLAVNYQNTVLRAAQEVEDAMVAFLKTQEEVKYLAYSVEAAMRSVDLSMIQYREGLTDYQRVLDTQRFQTQAQDFLTSTTGVVSISLIAMYKALGGGWETQVGKDFVPEDIKKEMEERTNWGNLLTPVTLETTSGVDGPKWESPEW